MARLRSGWVPPEIENHLPVPPPKKPRRQYPKQISPWLVFLRKLKPGQSFVCASPEAGAAIVWLKKMKIPFVTRRAPGLARNMIRIWITGEPGKAPELEPKRPNPHEAQRREMGKDLLVRIGVVEHGFQCDTLCFIEPFGDRKEQRIVHQTTRRDFASNYPILLIQDAAAEAIHTAMTDLEKTHLRKAKVDGKNGLLETATPGGRQIPENFGFMPDEQVETRYAASLR
jgi:hypothetical protein